MVGLPCLFQCRTSLQEWGPDQMGGLYYMSGPIFLQGTRSGSSWVCTTVTALRTAQVEHHIIPALCLTPAAPKGKGTLCLILEGNKKGQICVIQECRSRKQQVILCDETTLAFDDVCSVIDAALP